MERPSTPESSSVAASLNHVVQRLSRRLRKRAGYRLTPSRVSVLVTLERWGPLRLGEVAQREQIEKSSMTRLVVNLESAGYLIRSPDPEDEGE